MACIVSGISTARLIDSVPRAVNAGGAMDEDDFFTSRPQDPLTLLVKQDLGPLSVDELNERIAILKDEIARVEAHMAAAAAHLSAADELFKKS
jgi:uncharacterized small protein (DUF1192 family)